MILILDRSGQDCGEIRIMKRPVQSRLLPLLLLAGVVAALAAGSSTGAEAPVVSANAYGIAVVVPGQPGASAAASSAPGPASSGSAGGFAYPADGVGARSGPLSSSVSAKSAETVGSQAVADVFQLSLLNGEITADSVAARAQATGDAADTAGSAVANLVLLGTPVAAAPNQSFPLADWGYAVTLEAATEATVVGETKQSRSAITALRVVLTADHGGLPAGTQIQVGRAEAAASLAVAPPAETAPTTTAETAPSPKPKAKPKPKKPLPEPPEPESGRPGPINRPPPTDVSAPLSPSGYVFPVYGPSSFGDTFGAPRAGVVWH